jgi:hypothetical protein
MGTCSYRCLLPLAPLERCKIHIEVVRKAAAIMNEGICLQGMWLSEEVAFEVNVGKEDAR